MISLNSWPPLPLAPRPTASEVANWHVSWATMPLSSMTQGTEWKAVTRIGRGGNQSSPRQFPEANPYRAADAATHLFLAYLRSRSPDNTKGAGGVTDLPRALQSFLSSTEYPPVTPTLLQTSTYKVLMIVDRVSPTPFQLLRRSKHFEYRDDMEALQDFSYYEDPVSALTDECRRVLNAISSVNSTSSSQGADRNNGWLQFESRGFNHDFDPLKPSKPASIAEDVGAALPRTHRDLQGLRSTPGVEFDSNGRPKTPSWGDFLSRGFVDEKTSGPGPMLLHPNKQLPPIGERAHSSQSHMRKLGDDLEPGELASITTLELDETFWWVWLTSLAGEETAKRKAIFGRCCMIETKIHGAKWLIVEEQVKGASPGPDEGAYIAEKKSKFSWTRRSRNKRTKSTKQKEHPYTDQANTTTPASKTSIGLDQQAKIQAAAAELARKQQTERQVAQRRARKDEASSIKTNSVLTIQPALKADALPAMKWAKEFDKDVIRAKYLQDKSAGKGAALDEPIYERVGAESNGSLTPTAHNGSYQRSTSRLDKEVPPAPLPVTPTKDISQAQLAESSSAAKVPLPPGPEDKPSPRPPIPAPQQPDLNQHPALRNQPTPQPESPPQQKTSPPAKAAPKKLKKHSGGGGFKKLFSSKKKETASRSGTPQPTHLEEPEPSAADEPVQSASLAPPEAAVNPGRASPVITHSPAIEQSPAAEAVRHHDDDYPPPTSREQHEADREFSRFDQGPLQDVPAFVPEDESPKPSRSRTPQQTASTPTHQYEDPISPVEDARRDDADNESEVSVDLARQVSPQDRWAEIRRQAQERAQRMSEENTRRSQRSQSVRTDEGETSGEETIEHRVARIKARVAELTGQMDSSGTVRNSPR